MEIYNNNLDGFFGFFVDGRLQLAVAESEVAKIFYANNEIGGCEPSSND